MAKKSARGVALQWLDRYKSTQGGAPAAEQAMAEAGACKLYAALGQSPTPEIIWADDPTELAAYVKLSGKKSKNGLIKNHIIAAGDWMTLNVPPPTLSNANEQIRLTFPRASARGQPSSTEESGLFNGQFSCSIMVLLELAFQERQAKQFEPFVSGLSAVMAHCAAADFRDGLAVLLKHPSRIALDERNRLHNINGTAVEWPTLKGSIYAVRGIRLEQWMYEGGLTPDVVMMEPNLERRQAMLQVYGYDKFLRDADATQVSKDDWGTLWEVQLSATEGRARDLLTMVEVLNSTPEPDGTFKTYFIRVSPDCRILTPEGLSGRAQERTPLNAIASTFGMTGPEYVRAVNGVQT